LFKITTFMPPPKTIKKAYMGGVEDFFRKYYNSPAFERNVKSGESTWYNNDIPSLRKELLSQINNLQNTYDKRTSTWYSGGTVNMGNPDGYLNQPADGVYAHEVSHAGDNKIIPVTPRQSFYMLDKDKAYQTWMEDAKKMGLENKRAEAGDATKKEKVKKLKAEMVGAWKSGDKEAAKNMLTEYNLRESGFYDDHENAARHDSAPGEIRGDINALRYFLAKNGVWDITDPKSGTFGPDQLKAMYQLSDLNKDMMKDGWKTTPKKRPTTSTDSKGNKIPAPKNPGLFLERLRERFSDQELMWLINNVAKNSIEKRGNESEMA
jgi:hypothetical protein